MGADVHGAITDLRYEVTRSEVRATTSTRLSWCFRGARKARSMDYPDYQTRDVQFAIDPLEDMLGGARIQAECEHHKQQAANYEHLFRTTAHALGLCHDLLRRHNIPIPGVDESPINPNQES